MKKLILTFEVLNGITDQTAFAQGVELARIAMQGLNPRIVNPMVGVEVKAEPRTHAVELRPIA